MTFLYADAHEKLEGPERPAKRGKWKIDKTKNNDEAVTNSRYAVEAEKIEIYRIRIW